MEKDKLQKGERELTVVQLRTLQVTGYFAGTVACAATVYLVAADAVAQHGVTARDIVVGAVVPAVITAAQLVIGIEAEARIQRDRTGPDSSREGPSGGQQALD